jgi:8-oxo-dGTP pyrophosphatase MutT (NUDIX family)
MKEKRNHVKELLLADLKDFTYSYWKNEESGEKQVRFFISLVAAILGGMAIFFAFAIRDGQPAVLFPVLLFAAAALLAPGLLTLRRVLKRHELSDDCLYEIDQIRRRFRDYFDEEGILSDYRPFGKPAPQGRRAGRTRGGLAYLVAIINSLIVSFFFIFAGLILMDAFGLSGAGAMVGGLAIVSLPAAASFLAVLVLQNRFTKRREDQYKAELNSRDFTHAGGVVYRMMNNHPEFLIITSRKNPEHWILPRGHIESLEAADEAAVREIREETGLVGRIASVLGTIEYQQEAERVKVKFFLIEKIGGDETDAPEGRQWRWCQLNEALALVSFQNYRTQLEIAFRRLDEIIEPD